MVKQKKVLVKYCGETPNYNTTKELKQLRGHIDYLS